MMLARICAMVVLFGAFLGTHARAREAQPVRSSAERSSNAGTFEFGPSAVDGIGGWKLFMGESNTDTLQASRQDVFAAAEQALESDGWRVQLSDTTTGRIVTYWKPLHHILVRLFAGGVRARCFVAVSTIGTRSSVAFQAGLASKHTLEGNPMLALARHAYRSAARDWHSEVRQYVAAGAASAIPAALVACPTTQSSEPPPPREAQ